MTKYYCPDHPRQVIHDSNPPGQLPGQDLCIPPTIVKCPLDDKEYYLEKCKSDDTFGP